MKLLMGAGGGLLLEDCSCCWRSTIAGALHKEYYPGALSWRTVARCVRPDWRVECWCSAKDAGDVVWEFVFGSVANIKIKKTKIPSTVLLLKGEWLAGLPFFLAKKLKLDMHYFHIGFISDSF